MEAAFRPGFRGTGTTGLLPLVRLNVDGNDTAELERPKGGGSFRRVPSAGP